MEGIYCLSGISRRFWLKKILYFSSILKTIQLIAHLQTLVVGSHNKLTLFLLFAEQFKSIVSEKENDKKVGFCAAFKGRSVTDDLRGSFLFL